MNESIIRVVLFREEDLWVAQCLEHDICVQAQTKDLALKLVLEVIEIEKNDDKLNSISKAPDYFYSLWAKHSGGESDAYDARQMTLCA